MPVAGCAADLPTDVCCSTWWLIGERIRTIAFNAVCACIDASCHDTEMRSFQTEGEITDLEGESVICSYMGTVPRSDTNSRRGFGPLRINRVEYRVEVREQNWPPEATLHTATQTILRADDETRHAITKHARAHAEKMWRALSDAAGTTIASRRMFNPTTHPFVLNRGVTVGSISPLKGMSHMIGYRVTVTVDSTLP